MLTTRQLATAIFAIIGMTATAFTQGADTACVPFLVNANAKVTAIRNGDSASMTVTANSEKTLTVPLGGATSVWNTGRNTETPNAPIVTASRGNITLRLPAESYRNAEIALHSVNGKRVLRGRAAATEAVNAISHKNAPAGVYLLSIKGVNGNAFAARLKHSGGIVNINAAFDVKGGSRGGHLAKAAAAGDWAITVSATGYADSAYALGLAPGQNPRQEINLRMITAPPSMSPRDSILDHIDKNWQSLGYSSRPGKYIALTFDDGPCAQTGSVLSALKDKKVSATFFMIGQNIRGNRQQASAAFSDGHELASHSDGYNGLGGSTAQSTIAASLTAAASEIEGITGKKPTLFRAPNVEYGANLSAVCAQQGLAIIGVSVWSNDYQSGLPSSTITNNVLNAARDGGIINCHEPNTAPNTPAAIPAMIDGLRQRGYWVCTVGDLAIIKGRTLKAGERYDDL